ncbi:adenosine receptor A2a-like [Oculina patagonica]
MANITGDGNFTSKLNQTLNPSPAGTVEVFSALNIFLSILASLGNALILVALYKVSSIQPPTKLFFQNLAVTDLCVGVIVQPLFTTYINLRETKTNANVSYDVLAVCGALGYILCVISLLTSTAISVDRLLVLSLGPRYRYVVTLRRVRVHIICFWLIGSSTGLIRMWRKDIASNAASILVTLSLVTSVFCYTRIYLKLRHYQAQVQNQDLQGQPNGAGIPLNVARYKKTVSSIMWVQLALVVCYVPLVLYVNGMDNYVMWNATATLIYLNSSLNPIFYCWKIREVRQAAKDTIRQLNCF